MSAPLVEVVVDHWRRPANVTRLLRAFRAQTVPCRVTLVNCSPGGEFPDEWRGLADRVLVIPDQGSQTRFTPVGLFDCEYTYWQDNDMEPGRRCIEHFLEFARRAGDFSVLGQLGRKWPERGSYEAVEIPREAGPVAVDFIVRAYFLRTRNLHWMEAFRWHAGYRMPIQDCDLLVSMALQFHTGWPCLLTPQNDDAETLVNREELPAPHAVCGDWQRHIDRRTEFVRRGIAAGWTPVCEAESAPTTSPCPSAGG